MRKLFRMQYESCTGQCYAYSDVMKIHTLGLDEQGAVAFLKRLLAIHGPSCGNPSLAYRLDHAEVGGRDVFIASFARYGSLDLFAAETSLGALNQMIDAALVYYESAEYKAFGAGNGHDVCHHGQDNKLLDFAIAFSGLPEPQRLALRAQFA